VKTLDRRIDDLERRLGLDEGESERIHYILLNHPGTNATKEEQARAFEDYLDRHPERRWRPGRMPTFLYISRDGEGIVRAMGSQDMLGSSTHAAGGYLGW